MINVSNKSVRMCYDEPTREGVIQAEFLCFMVQVECFSLMQRLLTGTDDSAGRALLRA